MCVSGDEDQTGSSTGTTGAGGVPEIVVTAPRLGLDMAVIQSVDWDEVARLTSIGAIGGAIAGGGWGALGGGSTGAAAAVESQDGIDLEDLFVIKHDMVVPPNTGMIYLY